MGGLGRAVYSSFETLRLAFLSLVRQSQDCRRCAQLERTSPMHREFSEEYDESVRMAKEDLGNEKTRRRRRTSAPR